MNVDESTIGDIAAKTGYSLEMIRTKITLYKQVLKTTLERKLWEREQLKKTSLAAGSAFNVKLEHQLPLGNTPGPGPAPLHIGLNSANPLIMGTADAVIKPEPTDEWLPPADFDDGDAYIPPNSFNKRSMVQGGLNGPQKAKRARTAKRFTPHAKKILDLAWHRGIFQGKEQLKAMTNTQVYEAIANFCDLSVKQVRKWVANKKQKLAKMIREGQVVDTNPPVELEKTSGGRFSSSQKKVLETAWDSKAWQFFKNPKLLVLLTGLEEKQVRKWFQNRKDKLKREGVPIDF